VVQKSITSIITSILPEQQQRGAPSLSLSGCLELKLENHEGEPQLCDDGKAYIHNYLTALVQHAEMDVTCSECLPTSEIDEVFSNKIYVQLYT
jgi:hypothetical protein